MNTYTSISGDQLSLYFPMANSLEYQIYAAGPDSPYSEDARLFDINYNFETGLFEFIPYKPRDPDAGAYLAREEETEWTTFVSTGYRGLELELEDYFSDLPIEADSGGITPSNMGGGVIYQNIQNVLNFFASEAFSLWGDIDGGYRRAQTKFLAQKMRGGILESFARSVKNNQPAFDYGEYNLEVLTDEIVLNPSDEILDLGYNFIYLDDGRIFVEPPPKGGWLDIKDRLLPRTGETFCCPDRKELFDVESIKERTLDGYKIAIDDPRLTLNPKKVSEPPYSHILSRMNLAACEGNIIATIRIYAIEYFIQGYATFNKFPPRNPQNHADVLAEYIAQRMKEGLLDQHNQPGAPVWPPGLIPGTPILGADHPLGPVEAEKLHAYWYEFLEQCVQIYSRRIKAGVSAVTPEIDLTMTALQEVVDGYQIPKRTEWRATREVIAGVMALTGILIPFIPIMLANLSFKKYKRKVKIDALRANEEFSMIILKQLIKEELNRIADDVPFIFEEPPGGRIDNVYVDFLRNVYSIEGRNIFDMPLVFNPDGSKTSEIILSDFDGAVIGDSFTNDQFMLECYIRGDMSEAFRLLVASTTLGSWEDGQAYSFKEVQNIFSTYESEGGDLEQNLDLAFSSLNYGLRLVYVPSDSTVIELEETYGTVNLFERLRTVLYLNNTEGLLSHPSRVFPGGLVYGEFTLPIVYSEVVESPLGGTMGEFMSRASESTFNFEDSAFNWGELALIMTGTDQFRTMFEYSSPLNAILSLVGIYNAEGFLDSIGGADDWKLTRGLPRPFRRWNRRAFPVIKRKLKKQFNKIYNSNDFAYIDEDSSSDRATREEVRRLREEFGFEWPDWSLLTPPVTNRLVFTNPMCYSEDTDTDSFIEPDESPGDTGSSGGPSKPPAWEDFTAPEKDDVSRGLPDIDYGYDPDLVPAREMEFTELEDMLLEFGELAALDLGGYELLEELASGVLIENPAGLPFDLVDIIAQWTDPRRWPDYDAGGSGGGSPAGSESPGGDDPTGGDEPDTDDDDGDDDKGAGGPGGGPRERPGGGGGGPGTVREGSIWTLVDQLAAAGLDLAEGIDPVFVMQTIIISERFAGMSEEGIQTWGQYNGFFGREDEFVGAVNAALDFAEANPGLISAATTIITGLTTGNISLIV